MLRTLLGRGWSNLRRAGGTGNLRLFLRMLLNYLSAYLRFSAWVPLPVEIQVEPSSVCNLKCSMCIVSIMLPQAGVTSISSSDFSNLLNQLPSLRAVNLTGIGESLLNRGLEEMIAAARQEGIRVSFITNGQLLDEGRAEKVIQSGVETISFSLEAAQGEPYERIRRGASWAKLEKNITFLLEKIKEKGAKTAVVLNVVLLKESLENPAHLRQIIDFASRLGVKNVTLQNPHDLEANGTLIYFKEKKESLEKLFRELRAYAAERRVNVTLPNTTIKEGSCYYPWVYPQITAAGELLPCCLLSQFDKPEAIVGRYSFGNVFKDGFAQSWNSPRAKLFRKSLADRQPNEFCRRCSKYLGVL